VAKRIHTTNKKKQKMGNKFLDIRASLDFSKHEIDSIIKRKLKVNDFRWKMEKQSLDARNKSNIQWQLRIIVHSDEIKSEEYSNLPTLEINYKKRKENIAIIGSGPAGFFAAYCLQKAGFQTSIFERGSDVEKREKQIIDFEKNQHFSSEGNYAFGEGGAGTFSDGKLTSRSKRIKTERAFVIETYIEAGAPEEIRYLSKPHLGSDNLKNIVANLRKTYIQLGGEIQFSSQINKIHKDRSKNVSIETKDKEYQFDYLIVATGHSAYDSYEMMMEASLPFQSKAFAIGFRVEHLQKTINIAQWGSAEIPSLKAADYTLTHKTSKGNAVYSFCMCPGGKIIPATAYEGANIVNGMSNYNRDGKYANAAIVAALDLREHLGKELKAIDALHWLKELEQKFYTDTSSYAAPANSIKAFLKNKSESVVESSYPFSLYESDLLQKMPFHISDTIKEGIKAFSKKLKDYETGNLIGLESKTSSPIQAIRNKDHTFVEEERVYICGEGSGFTGGIISSATDGVKTAMHLIQK